MYVVSWVQHAVGQGGFHTGRAAVGFESAFNWMFDCGASSRSRFDRTMREWTTRNLEPLDWLFISHFDTDHVSGLDTMMSRTEVRDVMVPYVNDRDLVHQLLFEIDRGNLDRAFVELVADPGSFFLGRGAERVTFLRDDGRAMSGRPPSPSDPEAGGPRDDGDHAGKYESDGRRRWVSRMTPAPRPYPAASGTGRTRNAGPRIRSVQGPCEIVATEGMLGLRLEPYRAPIQRNEHRELLREVQAIFGTFPSKARPGLGDLAHAIARHARTAAGRRYLRGLFQDHAGSSNRSSLSLLSTPVAPAGNAARWQVSKPWVAMAGHGPVSWVNTGDAELLAPADVEDWRAHYHRDLADVRVLALPHHGSDRNSDYMLPNLCPDALLVAHARAGARKHPGPEVSFFAGPRLAIVTEHPGTEVAMEFFAGP